MSKLKAFSRASRAVGKVLTQRKYAALALLTAASTALAQIFLIIMTFWSSIGWRSIEFQNGIYFSKGLALPVLLRDSLFYVQEARGETYTDFLSTVAANPTLAMERAAGGTMQVPIMDRVVYMLPQQFGLIILTSILIGVYMSLLVFYSRRGKSCRRVGGYGVAGSGAGLSTSIVSVGVTASQVCGTGCSSILVSLPLVAGLGLNLFGVSYAVLFPVVSVAVLISAIYWIASKTRT